MLGIDPGLRFLGFGVVRRLGGRLSLIDYGQRETDTEHSLERRQRQIWHDLDRLIRYHDPDVIAYEDQAGVAAAARESQKRQLEAARRGRTIKSFHFSADNDGVTEVVGMIKGLAFHYGIPLRKYQPRTVKVTVLGRGNASADKAHIQQAIARIFGLREIKEHAADAVSIAVTGEQRTWLEARRAG